MESGEKLYDCIVALNLELQRLMTRTVEIIAVNHSCATSPDPNVAFSEVLSTCIPKLKEGTDPYAVEKLFDSSKRRNKLLSSIDICTLDRSLLLNILLNVKEFLQIVRNAGPCASPAHNHICCDDCKTNCDHSSSTCTKCISSSGKPSSKCQHACKTCKKTPMECEEDAKLCCGKCRTCVMCNEENSVVQLTSMVTSTPSPHHNKPCSLYMFVYCLRIALNVRRLYGHITVVELQGFIEGSPLRSFETCKDHNELFQHIRSGFTVIMDYISDVKVFPKESLSNENYSRFMKSLDCIFSLGKPLEKYLMDNYKEIRNQFQASSVLVERFHEFQERMITKQQHQYNELKTSMTFSRNEIKDEIAAVKKQLKQFNANYHQKDLEPKDIVLPECLEVISQDIGDNWRSLADLLHLSTDGTSKEQLPYVNMMKCFDNAGKLISWKALKNSFEILEIDYIIQKLKDETNLTIGLARCINQHRQKILSDVETTFASEPFMGANIESSPPKKRRDELYVDLTVVNQREYMEEYSECENFLKKMCEKKQTISMGQLVHLHDKFVLITGNAGIGKTELIENVTLKWAERTILNGRDGMPNIQLLFPIKCRELNTMDFQPTDNSTTILHRLYPDLFKQITANDLQDISHKIMFIVDGLDEMVSVEKIHQPEKINNPRDQKIVYFVRDILVSNIKIFQNQYIVAAGRSYISNFIKKSLKRSVILKCVYVCGFNEESICQYIEKHCDRITKEKVSCERKLSQHLSAMSHVPVYLWVICNIYKEDISIKAPRTTTELMMYACLVFIRRHLIDEATDVKNLTLTQLCNREDIMQLIKSICWMSFDSLINKRVLFENHHLGDVIEDVEELEKKTGFIVKSSNGEFGALYQFSHLVLHELFCGLHMFFSPTVTFTIEGIPYEPHLVVDASGVRTIKLEKCYAVVSCVEGLLQTDNENNILRYFLEKLRDKYNFKINQTRSLFMEELHRWAELMRFKGLALSHDTCSPCGIDVLPHENMMYLRCCFESNCTIPPIIANSYSNHCFSNLIINNILELQWQYNFFKKINLADSIIHNICVDNFSNIVHEKNTEALSFFVNKSKKHVYINGCTKIYERILANFKCNKSNLEVVEIKNLSDNKGLYIILPYLKAIELRGSCDYNGRMELIEKIKQLPSESPLKNLEVDLGVDEWYNQAVYDATKYLRQLNIKYLDGTNVDTISCLVNMIQKFSQSGELSLKSLAIEMKDLPNFNILLKCIDCIRHIGYTEIICKHATLSDINSFETAVNAWITTNKVSVNSISNVLKCKAENVHCNNATFMVIRKFNTKYDGTFSIDI